MGTPPVCDLARVFTGVGLSYGEGDRVELSPRLGRLVVEFEPAPVSLSWTQTLRDAEVVEHSHRGASSVAFRHKAAKAMLTEHVSLALHHGVLRASNDCVLIHEDENRETSATRHIANDMTNMVARTPPEDLGVTSATSVPPSATVATPFAAPARAPGCTVTMGGMVNGAGNEAFVERRLPQHSNHEVCRTGQEGFAGGVWDSSVVTWRYALSSVRTRRGREYANKEVLQQ